MMAAHGNRRTAVAYNDQYIFFIVVDGRDDDHSKGMTIRQLAEFSKNTLGASYGIAQDGGGSSTMVVSGQVVNNTYCNNVDCNNLREQGLSFGPQELTNPEPGEPTRLSATESRSPSSISVTARMLPGGDPATAGCKRADDRTGGK
jgi:hypothetical protein